MKANFLKVTLLLLITYSTVLAQEKPKADVLDIIGKVKNNLHYLSDPTDSVDVFVKYLNFIEKIEKGRRKITGSISFGLNGNEVDNNNLYIINTGIEANYDNHPLEINAKTDLQTQIDNGKFEEIFSTLYMSMDYHPFNSINHEAYAFVKRTKIKFLGIDQRYEVGGGYIYNFFSSKPKIKGEKLVEASTIKKGRDLLDALKKWKKKYPQSDLENMSIYKCLRDDLCGNVKVLDESEVKRLFAAMDNYEKVFRKKYSHIRMALLVGLNYEIENTDDELKLYDTPRDTIFTNNFESTNLYRLVFAPKIELLGDNYKWKTTCYFKQAFTESEDDKYTNEDILVDPDNEQILTDKRTDYFIDLQTTFEFQLNKKLTLAASWNYIYDNAPKRQYYLDPNGLYRIAKADDTFTSIVFKLKYTL